MEILSNYSKTFFRTLKKNPLFSTINILGFSIGLAASLAIFLWVQDELSYDQFHQNKDRIFRVERDIMLDSVALQVPITPPPMGAAINQEFEESESFVRVLSDEITFQDFEKKQFRSSIFFTDSNFFNFFSYKLLKGNPDTCLTSSRKIVLSETLAERYFGNKPRIGAKIPLIIGGQPTDFLVCGIMENMPYNSHLRTDAILSISNIFEDSGQGTLSDTNWMSNFLYTYVLLDDANSAERIEAKMGKLVDENIMPLAEKMEMVSTIQRLDLKLRPITQIHLEGNPIWEQKQPGNRNTVMIFSLVSILLLVIASINFINLSTARASKRAKEVSIRKISGATNGQLVKQFMTETFIFSFVALIVALLILEITLPLFNAFIGKSLHIFDLLSGWNLIFLLLIWIITTLISGFYPAFFLASYKPAMVVRGKTSPKGGKLFRTIMVAGQFTISTGLIISAFIAYNQMNYIYTKDLGYDRSGLINIPVEDQFIFEGYDDFSSELVKNPSIASVSRSMQVPTEDLFGDFPVRIDTGRILFPVINYIDTSFINTFRIKIIAGRNFTEEMYQDSAPGIIINEAALELFNFTSPDSAIGIKLKMLNGIEDWTYTEGIIEGVTENFNYQPLSQVVRPKIMILSKNTFTNITIRAQPAQLNLALQDVKKVWKNHYPDYEFQSFFIAHKFFQQHAAEKRLQMVILIFTLLSVFVACLGLFGLSSFSVERRTKEVGIRKTLGAGSFRIITLISGEFSKLVLIAGAIAIPASWYIMSRWLDSFPYHYNIEYWIFLVSVLLAWIVSMSTVLVNANQAAKMDPVETLKYE